MELVYNEFVRRNMSGFTLIELILVMAIIMILSVIGIGSYTQATIKSKDTQRKSDLSQIAKALELFNNDVGRYPKTSAGAMTCLKADGTEELCNGAIYAYIGDTKATYMKTVPADQTASREYVYGPDETFGSFALYAALENLEDRDVVITGGVVTDWDNDCGSVKCNYKLTETGVIRTK